jgi:hypothetical protein
LSVDQVAIFSDAPHKFLRKIQGIEINPFLFSNCSGEGC